MVKVQNGLGQLRVHKCRATMSDKLGFKPVQNIQKHSQQYKAAASGPWESYVHTSTWRHMAPSFSRAKLLIHTKSRPPLTNTTKKEFNIIHPSTNSVIQSNRIHMCYKEEKIRKNWPKIWTKNEQLVPISNLPKQSYLKFDLKSKFLYKVVL